MIRKMVSDDVETLKNDITEFDTKFLDKKSEYEQNFVAEYNGIIVGLLNYSLIYERIELNYIWVKKEYRRKKIATDLLNIMLEKDNIENITLEVNENNQSAIELYKKLGFVIISKRENYYNGQDAYLMMREMIK